MNDIERAKKIREAHRLLDRAKELLDHIHQGCMEKMANRKAA